MEGEKDKGRDSFVLLVGCTTSKQHAGILRGSGQTEDKGRYRADGGENDGGGGGGGVGGGSGGYGDVRVSV